MPKDQRSAKTPSSDQTIKSSRTFKIDQLGDAFRGAATKREMFNMILEIEGVKKENEQLMNKQAKKIGITIDAVDVLKSNLDKAKAINASLLEEVENGKAMFDKLNEDFLQMKAKFDDCRRQIRVFRKERQLWDDTSQLLIKTEDKCRKFSKSNSRLRAVLMKHHIDPNVNAKDIDTCMSSRKSSPKERRPVNAVSLRRKLTQKSIKWN